MLFEANEKYAQFDCETQALTDRFCKLKSDYDSLKEQNILLSSENKNLSDDLSSKEELCKKYCSQIQIHEDSKVIRVNGVKTKYRYGV